MPLKKDASGRRSVALEFDLQGTPEQIWQVMATGPGYSAWFMPAEIEERVGGAVRFHFGDMTSSGQVTVWQPPFRFSYEEVGWSGEAPPLATEIVVETRSGGTCTVRMVHSLFTEKDDWDSELEGMLGGWPPFFGILRTYLRCFAGMHAASARSTGAFEGEPGEAWLAVQDALGLANARVGETRDTSVDGAPRLVGVVEAVRDTPTGGALTLRLEQPLPGVALIGTYVWGGRTNVVTSLYFYGDQADPVLAREGARWDAWMAERFASPDEGR